MQVLITTDAPIGVAPARSSCRSSPIVRSTASQRRSTPRSAASSPTRSQRTKISGKLGEHVLVHAKDRPYHRVSPLARRSRKVRARLARPLCRAAPSAISDAATSRRSQSRCRRKPRVTKRRCASFVAEGAIAGTLRDDASIRSDPNARMRRRDRDRRQRLRSRRNSSAASRAARSLAKR